MSSNPVETTPPLKGREDRTNNNVAYFNNSNTSLDIIHEFKDDQNPNEVVQRQLMVYESTMNGGAEVKPNRVVPFVGAFTVQCAICLKWRLIPTKEKYEEIREFIIQRPFICEMACEWQPEVDCEDPSDITPDGNRVWAMDKPSIPQPPNGWQRLLRIRGEGGSKFADVYYVAPSGKRMRSMVEVERTLLEHPEYVHAGVKLSQFSFQIPRPSQENYVRKQQRPARPNSSIDDSSNVPVKPLAVLRPDEEESPGLQFDRLSDEVGLKKPKTSSFW